MPTPAIFAWPGARKNACWGAPQTRCTSGQSVQRCLLSAAPALPLLGLVPLVRVAEQTVDVPLDRHSLPHIRLGLAVLRIEGFFLFRQLPPLLFQRVHLWELRPIQQLIDRRLCRPVVSQLRPMLGQIFFAVPGRLVTVEYGPRLCVWALCLSRLPRTPHKPRSAQAACGG